MDGLKERLPPTKKIYVRQYASPGLEQTNKLVTQFEVKYFDPILKAPYREEKNVDKYIKVL